MPLVEDKIRRQHLLRLRNGRRLSSSSSSSLPLSSSSSLSSTKKNRTEDKDVIIPLLCGTYDDDNRKVSYSRMVKMEKALVFPMFAIKNKNNNKKERAQLPPEAFWPIITNDGN